VVQINKALPNLGINEDLLYAAGRCFMQQMENTWLKWRGGYGEN